MNDGEDPGGLRIRAGVDDQVSHRLAGRRLPHCSRQRHELGRDRRKRARHATMSPDPTSVRKASPLARRTIARAAERTSTSTRPIVCRSAASIALSTRDELSHRRRQHDQRNRDERDRRAAERPDSECHWRVQHVMPMDWRTRIRWRSPTYDYNPTTTQRVLANVEGRYNFAQLAPVHWTRSAGDQLVLHERLWGSPLVVDENGGVGGDATSAYNTGNRFLGEGFFTLTPWSSSSKGTFTATLGASTERNRTELNFVEGTGFSSPALHDVGNATTVTVYGGSRGANNLVSYFARANLNLAERYLASASIRADGSSRFGPNNRYGVFPRASLGWVITQEPMLSGLSRLGSIKLRGSYGLTGNQGIDNTAYRATYGTANYGKTAGITPTQLCQSRSQVGADQGNRCRLRLDDVRRSHRPGRRLLQQEDLEPAGFASRDRHERFHELHRQRRQYREQGSRVRGHRGICSRERARRHSRGRRSSTISTNKNRVTALYSDQPFTAESTASTPCASESRSEHSTRFASRASIRRPGTRSSKT